MNGTNNVLPIRTEYRIDLTPDIGVSTLCYMEAYRALIIGCEDGRLYFLPFSTARGHGPSEWPQLIEEQQQQQEPWAVVGDGVASIGCNDDGTLLVAADTAGSLQVWRIAGPGSGSGGRSGSGSLGSRSSSLTGEPPQLTLIAAHTMRRLARLSPGQRATMQRTLRAIFNTVDSDHSGMIETEEFYQMCVRLDSSMTDYDIKRAWAGMDMDGDAKITFDEFVEWWEEEDRKKATVKVSCISFMGSSSGGGGAGIHAKKTGFCCGDEAGNLCHFRADGRFCGVLQPDGAPIMNVNTAAA
eukprot:COSAG06_NODE_8943_length_2027_cov_1.756743_2_plen_298_part_00